MLDPPPLLLWWGTSRTEYNVILIRQSFNTWSFRKSNNPFEISQNDRRLKNGDRDMPTCPFSRRRDTLIKCGENRYKTLWKENNGALLWSCPKRSLLLYGNSFEAFFFLSFYVWVVMFSTEFKCTGNDRNIASDENAILKTKYLHNRIWVSRLSSGYLVFCVQNPRQKPTLLDLGKSGYWDIETIIRHIFFYLIL